jgi:signal peptidase I
VERGRGLVWFVVVVAAAGLATQATLFDTWTVPEELGAGAEPTLGSGDVVLVGKRPGGDFGDLVRCTTTEEGRPAIGRIVGGSGDHVETDGAALTVNARSYGGQTACPTARVTVESPRFTHPIEISCDVVEMGSSWHYRGSGGAALTSSKTTRVVPAGMVFLLSDDRDIHDDSRDFGPVRPETCHKVYFRLWGKRGWSDDRRRMSVIR